MFILTGALEGKFDSTHRCDGPARTLGSTCANYPHVLSMDSPKRRQLAVSLAYRVGKESAPVQIAQWIALMCEEIGASLMPVLGQPCIATIYQRGLHLTGSAHPWLSHLHDRIQATMDLSRLRLVLGQQTSSNAAAGGCTLLQVIRDLLASLIGAPLTERLLHSVWAHFYSGPTSPDKDARFMGSVVTPTV